MSSANLRIEQRTIKIIRTAKQGLPGPPGPVGPAGEIDQETLDLINAALADRVRGTVRVSIGEDLRPPEERGDGDLLFVVEADAATGVLFHDTMGGGANVDIRTRTPDIGNAPTASLSDGTFNRYCSQEYYSVRANGQYFQSQPPATGYEENRLDGLGAAKTYVGSDDGAMGPIIVLEQQQVKVEWTLKRAPATTIMLGHRMSATRAPLFVIQVINGETIACSQNTAARTVWPAAGNTPSLYPLSSDSISIISGDKIIVDDIGEMITVSHARGETVTVLGQFTGVAGNLFVDNTDAYIGFCGDTTPYTVSETFLDEVKITGGEFVGRFLRVKTWNATLQTWVSAETATSMAALINSTAAITTPVDADKIGFLDSVTGLFAHVTFANLKATFKAYFDTLYATAASVAAALSAWKVINGQRDTRTDLTPADGATATLNCSLGNAFKITSPDTGAGMDFTIALSNVPTGAVYFAIEVAIVVGTNIPTISYTNKGTNVTAPTLTASRTNIIVISTWDNGTTLMLNSAGAY